MGSGERALLLPGMPSRGQLCRACAWLTGDRGVFFPGSCVAAASSAQLMETTVLRPLAGPDCPWTSLRHPPLYVLHLLHLGGL